MTDDELGGRQELEGDLAGSWAPPEEDVPGGVRRPMPSDARAPAPEPELYSGAGQPPPRVWARIEEQLREEGVIR